MVPQPPRTGGALFRATRPFADEDARSWRLLATTLLAFAATEAFILAAPSPWLALLGSFVAAGIVTRLFIFFHDHLHGAIFRDSKAGRAIMEVVGLLTMTAPSVWQETHDYHHRNNAKLLGGSIGSFPVATVRMYEGMTPSQKFWYAFARHPLTMLLGYFTVFGVGMCISPFLRNPRKHWRAPVALAIHILGLVGLTLTLGWQAALFGLSLPVALALAAGSYLFYAQHNFPDIVLKDRSEWNYTFAALNSSSMFDMPAWMHWFTGNIGYHHVHHLNHRIPFYRLPEAMEALPELQNPGRTSWHPRDIAACLRLKLWDPDQQKMVGWDKV